MKEYRLENIACAQCSADMEKALNKLKYVRHAYVNFATSTIFIESPDNNKVIEYLKSSYPNIKIKEITRDSEAEDSSNYDKKKIILDLLPIIISFTIFILGIIFKNNLHNTYLSLGEYIMFGTAFFLSGRGVLWKALQNIIHGKVFSEYFLMSIATIGAILIRQLPEAVGVMLFFQIGEFFQKLSISHSRRSIGALLSLRPDFARLVTGKGFEKISPDRVLAGNIIVVKPGEKVPLDGIIIKGASLVDTSALTGEGIPHTLKEKDNILAGMILKTGMLKIRVTKVLKESSISRILDIVDSALRRKAKAEKFITNFAGYYTPFVVMGAFFIAILTPFFFPSINFYDSIYRALVLLVISCPCALVLSIPLSYFGGIGKASKLGILVKGSNYLDILTALKVVVFDKTGTLTQGVFKVNKIVAEKGFTEEDVLRLAADAESQSKHPVAYSIIERYGRRPELADFTYYEEVEGYGVIMQTGDRKIIAGNDRLLHRQKIKHPLCNTEGTVIHIALNDNYAGYIIISDLLKQDAYEAVASLRKTGIKKIMLLTGDSMDSAKTVADKLSLDGCYANLLPEDKVAKIEEIMGNCRKNEKVAFIGDGINDAPVIARSDLGIAMGIRGTDAAIQTADIVLMTDSPASVAKAIRTAKKTKRIVVQNIVCALSVKALFIVFGSLGLAGMWPAVFADIGVSLIAVFNAMRILR